MRRTTGRPDQVALSILVTAQHNRAGPELNLTAIAVLIHIEFGWTNPQQWWYATIPLHIDYIRWSLKGESVEGVAGFLRYKDSLHCTITWRKCTTSLVEGHSRQVGICKPG